MLFATHLCCNTQRDDGSHAGGPAAEARATRSAADAEIARERDEMVDEQLAHSFPASDPPSWVQGTAPEPT